MPSTVDTTSITLLQTLILGIVQGLTEFIPVSSSAHLVLVPWLLGWKLEAQAQFVFHILVQLGTLLALIVYFWRDLLRLFRAALAAILRRRPFETFEARVAWLLILASLPAGIVGITLEEFFKQTFGDPVEVAVELLGTSMLIWVGELIGRRVRRFESIEWRDAVAMGVGQAAAIFPGISRSAATIAFGLGRHLDRPSAARFSFLMAVPIFVGAGGVAVLDLFQIPNVAAQLPQFLAGVAVSAVVGYLCIRWLLNFLARRPMLIFAYYCTAISIVTLLVALVRGS